MHPASSLLTPRDLHCISCPGRRCGRFQCRARWPAGLARLARGHLQWRCANRNGAFNAGKSSYVLKVTPSQSGLVRKSSSDEYNFFRGVGATVRINNINITAIYSLRYLDALIDSTNNSFSSINTSGLFRTEDDWKRRNNVSAQAIGISC